MIQERDPCPFCAADGHSTCESAERFDDGHVAQVYCCRCGARGPSRYSEVSADDACRLAVDAWNKRGGQ